MLSGPELILALKILVTAVSVLFVVSSWAIATGRRQLHGRINTIFFILTMITVFGFELLLRLGTDVTSQFSEEAKNALRIHLFFAVPSAFVLPVMMFTGVKHQVKFHRSLGFVFALLWVGTFITGVFFLPHQ